MSAMFSSPSASAAQLPDFSSALLELDRDKIPVTEELSLARHPTLLYPLAMPHLMKPFKLKPDSIRLAQGLVTKTNGIVKITCQPLGKDLRSSAKRRTMERYVLLENGKMDIFEVISAEAFSDAKDRKMDLPQDVLQREQVLHLQRLFNIDYPSVVSKTFKLVFKTPRTEASANGKLGRSRGVSTSQFSLGSFSSRASMRSRASKITNVRTIQSQIGVVNTNTLNQRHRLNANPTGGSMIIMSTTGSARQNRPGSVVSKFSNAESIDSKTSKEAAAKKNNGARNNGSSIFAPMMRRLKSRVTEDVPAPVTSSTSVSRPGRYMLGTSVGEGSNANMSLGLIDFNPEQAQPMGVDNVSAKREGVVWANELFPYGKDIQQDEQEFEFEFEDDKLCRYWLMHVLLELDNVVKMFLHTTKMVQKKSPNDFFTQAFLLRKALDMMTLSRGSRNQRVWELRSRVALILGKIGEDDEANLWKTLAHNHNNKERTTMKKNIRANTKGKDQLMQAQRRKSNRMGTAKTNGSANTEAAKSNTRGMESHYSNVSALDESLATFLVENARAYINGDKELALEAAMHALKEHGQHLDVLTRLLEEQYGKIPDAFKEYYSAGKSPLERVQAEARQYKEERVPKFAKEKDL